MTLSYRLYQVHNLVWLWHTGSWPKAGYELDHRNQVKTDNRIENLREATRSSNCLNTGVRVDNSSGYKGVSLNKHGTYDAYANLAGKRTCLGAHTMPEKANEARQKFAKSHYGEFYPSF